MYRVLNTTRYQAPSFFTVKPIYFTRAFSELFIFIFCSLLPKLYLQILLFKYTSMTVKDNKSSQACGTSQDRNTIPFTIRGLQQHLEMPYLQSQQKCSSKENFKNKYLTHSPPQDFFLAEIMENKNAAHNLLHCVVQLLLSICTSLIFIELRTQ